MHWQCKCDLYYRRRLISLIDIYYYIISFKMMMKKKKKEFTVNGASIPFHFVCVMCFAKRVLACQPKRLNSSDYRLNFRRHASIFSSTLHFPAHKSAQSSSEQNCAIMTLISISTMIFRSEVFCSTDHITRCDESTPPSKTIFNQNWSTNWSIQNVWCSNFELDENAKIHDRIHVDGEPSFVLLRFNHLKNISNTVNYGQFETAQNMVVTF